MFPLMFMFVERCCLPKFPFTPTVDCPNVSSPRYVWSIGPTKPFGPRLWRRSPRRPPALPFAWLNPPPPPPCCLRPKKRACSLNLGCGVSFLGCCCCGWDCAWGCACACCGCCPCLFFLRRLRLRRRPVRPSCCSACSPVDAEASVLSSPSAPSSTSLLAKISPTGSAEAPCFLCL